MRPRIGRFSSTTLAGEHLAVPEDLDRPMLLVFAYRQSQQRQVDTWLRRLPATANVGVLEVPVLGRRWRPVRRFIDGGMASNMDLATRARTMCVYTDVDRFRWAVLGTRSEEVLAALVDEDGTTRWHALGRATDEAAAGLLRAVATITGED